MDEMNYNYPFPQYQPEASDRFATTSMILGMLSLLLLCGLYLSVPIGALGILFYLLGKRKDKGVSVPARVGLLASSVGLIVGTVIMIFSLYSALLLLKPENRALLDKQFEQTYGVDFDTYMENVYGDEKGAIYELFNLDE